MEGDDSSGATQTLQHSITNQGGEKEHCPIRTFTKLKRMLYNHAFQWIIYDIHQKYWRRTSRIVLKDSDSKLQ